MTRDAVAHRVIRASAGTGKTHQLTNQYIRLLAAGAAVDSILATTFTRKAAGEILDRVLERLAHAAYDDEGAHELASQIGAATTRAQFAALLRDLLQKLHRVRIATLDSFFQSLGRTFGFELGLPPGWEICEEADDNHLRQEALECVLERENEAILSSLYQRLTYGEMKRAVQAELMRIVKNLHEIYQETPAEAWNKIQVPRALFPAEFDDLLDTIEAFDLSGDGRMDKARTLDVGFARSEDWDGFFRKGLGPKVLSGENSYYQAIPDDLVALYQKLIQHAGSVLIEKLAAQTSATREFLEWFDREFRSLQLTTGLLRFGDVTQTLRNTMENAQVAAGLGYRLGGAVEHLLLDEFQDTSLSQWRVLEPLARAVVGTQAGRTFFCVGDVKQAIYGWRGGLSRIFETLGPALGQLEEEPLVVSYRSAQEIIDLVNRVFGGLGQLDLEKCHAALTSWQSRFDEHKTSRLGESGYVGLHTGPAQADDEKGPAHRGRHCEYVAERIRDLIQKVPAASIGVLCLKNDTLARMVYELRKHGVDASEEGGNPLTDSAAVELMLSLFTIADHPVNSVASFHVRNSPFSRHLAALGDVEKLSRHLRDEILSSGYGAFAQQWASRLVPACDQRELSRLDQLVVAAHDYQRRSTLRPGDFVSWVRNQRMPDPSDARVRVMTIHGAKGLEFDVVVLPELDTRLTNRTPAFVVRRDPEKLGVNFVCRHVREIVQDLMAPDDRLAFEEQRREAAEESLSLLYVALTRAKQALYMYIPGPHKPDHRDSWGNLLRQTLAPAETLRENATLFETPGNNWCGSFTKVTESPVRSSAESIAFLAEPQRRPRGLQHVAPSRHEGESRVALGRLFNKDERLHAGVGTLYHAWFATIEWLADGFPTEARLEASAQTVRTQLPPQVWKRLDRLIAEFRAQCQAPAIAAAFSRAAYVDPNCEGFPQSLRPHWHSGLAVQRVERERRFVVHDGGTLLNGSVDRLIWLGDGGILTAADIIDFKTDAIPPGNAAALAQRVAYYRPQLDAYRHAIARLAQLPVERVAARLAFTAIGEVVEL